MFDAVRTFYGGNFNYYCIRFNDPIAVEEGGNRRGLAL